MSRAFVKEDADAPEPPLPERPVSAAPNRVTPRGARLINETIARLKTELGGAADEATAAAMRRDLRYWFARQATMQIVGPRADADTAGFGARIVLRRGTAVSEVTIVGEDEADPSAGRIAWTAPLARVLDGAQAGDVVELEAGGRREAITVVAILANEREP